MSVEDMFDPFPVLLQKAWKIIIARGFSTNGTAEQEMASQACTANIISRTRLDRQSVGLDDVGRSQALRESFILLNYVLRSVLTS